MQVHIIYLNKEDRKLSSIANDIALNVTTKLKPLVNEIEKEKAGIFIYFGEGHSKIKIKASSELEKTISMIL